MEHEQSACTHTSFAHAVARFQLALASDGILKSQVANHLIGIMVVEVGMCFWCFSVIFGYNTFPLGGLCQIYSHDAVYTLSIAGGLITSHVYTHACAHTHTHTHTYTHTHTRARAHRYYYTTTQQMPVATMQEHAQ